MAASTPTSPASSAGGYRASDADRERATRLIQQAFVDGRLDRLEFDRRLEAALTATTVRELDAALAGLAPTGHRSAGPLPPPPQRCHGATRPAYRPTAEERSGAMLAHWLGLVTLFVGPAVVALRGGARSPYVRAHAVEAANFQLTFLGAVLALGVVTAATFGVAGVLFPVLFLAWFVLTGVGGLAAAAGNTFRYPLALRVF